MLLSGITLGICLFSLSFVMMHRNEQAYNRLAVSIIVILGLLASGSFLIKLSRLTAQLYVAVLPLVFFSLLPLIYKYQESLISTSTEGRSSQKLVHLVPTFFALLLSLSILFMPKHDFNALFFEDAAQLGIWSTINAVWFALMVVVWFPLSCFYLVHVLKRTKTYHLKLKNIFSNHTDKKMRWFVCFVGWMIITWAYSILALVFENSLSGYYVSESGVSWFLLVLVWIFCLHALQFKPALNEKLNIDEQEQYEHSGLDSEKLNRISQKIKQAVMEEKSYLDPEINAVTLAKKLGISPHYLSQTFSQEMNTTFYDYINSARIEAAKIELTTTAKTVLEIAINVGFNTRSSFYNAFKKNTGLTPSAYREQNKSN